MGCWRGALLRLAQSRLADGCKSQATSEHAKVHRMADRLKSFWTARRIVGSTLVATVLLGLESGPCRRNRILRRTHLAAGRRGRGLPATGSYVRSLPLAADRQSAVRDLWWQPTRRPTGPTGLLDRLAVCLAEVDERVSQLVAFCSQADRPTTLPDFSWLANSETPPLVRYNMRLYYARWLAQNGYDDEALAWTDGLTTADVVAPESLLFYRAVASHRLVQADRADATVAELLQRSDELPVRYQKLAALDAARPGRVWKTNRSITSRAAWPTSAAGSPWAARARRSKASRTA